MIRDRKSTSEHALWTGDCDCVQKTSPAEKLNLVPRELVPNRMRRPWNTFLSLTRMKNRHRDRGLRKIRQEDRSVGSIYPDKSNIKDLFTVETQKNAERRLVGGHPEFFSLIREH